MTDVPRHLLMIVPERKLESDRRTIQMVNSYCEAGTKVSLVCPPQFSDNREELHRLLHKSATVYAVPDHIPEGECYDLAQFLGRSLSTPQQRLSALLLTTGMNRQLYQSMGKYPLNVGRPLQWLLDAWYRKVVRIRGTALAESRYWLHYFEYQLPPATYRRYEKLIRLDCYNYFYFIQTLQINKSVEPIDAIFCSYVWSLPVGCLIKELLDVPLIFDSHLSAAMYMEDSNNREIAVQNEKWMYEACDQIIQPWATRHDDERPAFKRISGQPQLASQLNVAVLFDEPSTQTGTVYEHLNALRDYLPYQVSFIPATMGNASSDDSSDDLSLFDAIIVHYGVCLSLPDYIRPNLAQKLSEFDGLKLLFIQDEYEATETARCWMEKLRFDVVYTCVPEEGREFVYPKKRFPNTEFLPTLTGYVPEGSYIDEYALPLKDRPLVIAYRGRMLPYHYGELGYEKYEIGVEVKRLAEERGIGVDIEVDDQKRIYGLDWYRFLGSARATIGTESGSNVFDFDGKLKRGVHEALVENPNLTFHDIHRKLMTEHEGLVKMNQVSPKMFEAIRLRTALVLFEGAYSGVLKPHLHFIPLKKDFSNIDEVFKTLEDLDYLGGLTERAYVDIIESGTYSYQRFVEGISADIDARVARKSAFKQALPA